MSNTQENIFRKVLDKGHIELLDVFGDELTIVNAARVSFGIEKKTLSDGDVKLMDYLYKNKHMSPFRHLMFRFKIRWPEFVARQAYKHVVGIEATSTYCTQLHSWNEISGRYKPYDEFYDPDVWRTQSQDRKQCSDGVLDEESQKKAREIYTESMKTLTDSYNKLLEMGVAREQARIMLPLNIYTEVIWTCSAQALLNFIELRDEEHAQLEIREYAKVFREIIRERFPVLYRIWLGDPTY